MSWNKTIVIALGILGATGCMAESVDGGSAELNERWAPPYAEGGFPSDSNTVSGPSVFQEEALDTLGGPNEVALPDYVPWNAGFDDYVDELGYDEFEAGRLPWEGPSINEHIGDAPVVNGWVNPTVISGHGDPATIHESLAEAPVVNGFVPVDLIAPGFYQAYAEALETGRNIDWARLYAAEAWRPGQWSPALSQTPQNAFEYDPDDYVPAYDDDSYDFQGSGPF